MKGKKMIFIVGVGRSGTTLLQSMLNAHSEIIFLPEIHFIKNYLKKGSTIKGNKAEKIIKQISSDEYLKRLNLNLNPIIEKCKKNNEFQMLKFYNLLIEEYSKGKNYLYIGEKDPKNIEYLNVIKKFFPEAYIIHLIRDPRDVVLSRLKADWSKNRGVLTHSLTYKEQINLGIKEGNRLFKQNYIEIKYENLITNTKDTLSRITDLLEIKFEEEMLSYMNEAKKIVSKNESSWKKNVFKPVMKNNSNKWKHKMDKDDIFIVQNICYNSIERNNYEVMELKNNIFKKIFIAISKIGFKIIYKLYLLFHSKFRYRINQEK